MRHIFILFFTILFFFSCKQEEKIIPAHIIPYDNMVQVLTDVQLSEVAILFLRTKKIGEVPLPESLYKSVLSKYEITPQKFDESFTFYSLDTELMEKLYADVIVELTKRQAELEIN